MWKLTSSLPRSPLASRLGRFVKFSSSVWRLPGFVKGLMTALAVAVGTASLAGCVRYRHTAANGDETRFSAFLVKGEASKIAAHTTQRDAGGTNYARTVTVGNVKGETDSEAVAGLAEAIARGVATGANPAK